MGRFNPHLQGSFGDVTWFIWAVALYFLRGESGESEANVGAKYSHMVT